MTPVCAVQGCPDPARTRGWCHAHYTRWRRTGRPTPPTREERFWAKVEITDTCWLWIAGTTHDGYGHFWIGETHVGAHRYAYELLVGPIPAGLDLDHICCVTRCVRPDHLRPMTREANVSRARRLYEARRAAA
jgi:hypothetical protein